MMIINIYIFFISKRKEKNLYSCFSKELCLDVYFYISNILSYNCNNINIKFKLNNVSSIFKNTYLVK